MSQRNKVPKYHEVLQIEKEAYDRVPSRGYQVAARKDHNLLREEAMQALYTPDMPLFAEMGGFGLLGEITSNPEYTHLTGGLVYVSQVEPDAYAEDVNDYQRRNDGSGAQAKGGSTCRLPRCVAHQSWNTPRSVWPLQRGPRHQILLQTQETGRWLQRGHNQRIVCAPRPQMVSHRHCREESDEGSLLLLVGPQQRQDHRRVHQTARRRTTRPQGRRHQHQ